MDWTLVDYYDRRLTEYDRIYELPQRQRDLGRLRSCVAELLTGHSVLELACGTGYWTAVASQTAATVLATDVSPHALAAAKSRGLSTNVEFAQLDAYAIESVIGDFTAVLAAFWWSHVPRQRITEFLTGLANRLSVGTLVLVLDNRYVEGMSTPIARTDAQSNTYQKRQLPDGSTMEVLKNFPAPSTIERMLTAIGQNIHVRELDYYWYGRAVLRAQ